MTAVAVQPLPESKPEAPNEADLIRRFEREAVVPGWLEERYRQMRKDAKYLNETAYANEKDWQRGINILERTINSKLAQVFPADPWIAVKPERILGGELMDPQMVQQQSVIRRAVAQTNEALIQKLFDEAMGTLMFQGAAHDALSMGMAYVKITWHEDAGRDALGRTKNSDSTDQMAKLRRLASEYAAGEWDEDDGRYLELMHLSEYAISTAREAVEAGDPRAGRLLSLANASPGQVVRPYMLPEPERWIGCKITPVLPDNLRLDWDNVTAPELFYTGRSVTEKTWIHWEEIAETYGISLDEARMLGHRREDGTSEPSGAVTARSHEPENPEDADLDDTRRGDMVAVYERWDKTNHRYYCWAAGLDRFLHTEIPQVTSRYFFPYVQVYFDRAVRRYFPNGDVYKGKKQQEQVNQKLTDDDEARLARYPRHLIDDSVSDEDVARIEGCEPHKAIRIKGAEDVSKKVHPIMGTPYDPRLYDVSQDIRLLELQLGAPMQANGMVAGAKFATEAQIAQDHMMAQSGKSGDLLIQAMAIAATMIGDMANIAMPADTVQRLLGPGAFWPVYGREEVWRSMHISIETGGSARAEKRQNVESWGVAAKAITELLQTKMMAAQVGYDLNIEGMIANVLAELDIREPVEDIMRMMQMPMQPGLPMGGAPGGMIAGPGQGPEGAGPMPM